MAIYRFVDSNLTKVNATTFTGEKILERKHLQSALRNNLETILPDCLVIAEEFSEWSESQRRIDLLALDKNANLIVIELKRTETGSFMELQAIRYASMVSTLTYKRAVGIYEKHLIHHDIDANAEEKLLEFLEWDEPHEENFAEDVRIVLVSADFSKELTTAVIWLNDRDLDIVCIRLIPYKYGDDILVDIQQIVPLPEAEKYQVRIKQKAEEQREARKSNKDYTKYIYQNKEYNKRRLVFAVITDWVATNNPQSFDELNSSFPQNIRKGGMYLPFEEALELYEKQQIARHFLGEKEILQFVDGGKYAISNQWGKGNIERFIDHAQKIGIEIVEA